MLHSFTLRVVIGVLSHIYVLDVQFRVSDFMPLLFFARTACSTSTNCYSFLHRVFSKWLYSILAQHISVAVVI